MTDEQLLAMLRNGEVDLVQTMHGAIYVYSKQRDEFLKMGFYDSHLGVAVTGPTKEFVQFVSAYRLVKPFGMWENR